MKIVFILENSVHWVTPFSSLSEVPLHPPADLYVEAPDKVQEGWLFDRETSEFSPLSPVYAPSSEISTLEVSQQVAELRIDLVVAGALPAPNADMLHDLYMADRITRPVLQRLVDHGTIAATAFNEWVVEHEERYRY